LTWSFRSISIDGESEGDDGPFRNPDDSARLATIRAQAQAAGAEVVSPWKARHMFCLLEGHEPFPNDRLVLLRTGDLQWATEDVPSPVDPRGFRLSVTSCWLLPAPGREIDEVVVRRVSSDVLGRLALNPAATIELDKDTINGAAYLKLTVPESRELDPFVIAKERIGRLLDWARQPLDDAEAMIRAEWPTAVRATEEYWQLEYGVLFYDRNRSH
jgi:hypothetical protein